MQESGTKKESKQQVMFRFHPEQRKELKRISALAGRSSTQLVEDALAFYFGKADEAILGRRKALLEQLKQSEPVKTKKPSAVNAELLKKTFK